MQLTNEIDNILRETRAKKVGQDQYLGHCPAHDDKSPSLSISSNNNKILFKCHAGCSQDSVLMSFKDNDLWNSDYIKKDKYELKRTDYKPYLDADDNPHLKVQRIDYSDGSKSFRQYYFNSVSWVSGTNIKAIKPYNEIQWRKSDQVILVEGEKCAEILISKGIHATCVPKGANGWKKEYSHFFKDKTVTIIPDNDPPGSQFALTVGKDLNEFTNVKILILEGLEHKEDIFDWFNKGNSFTQFKELVTCAAIPINQWTPTSESKKSIFKSLSDFESKKAEWFWKDRVPTPGVTLLEGDGGIGKSFITADLVARATTGKALPGDVAKDPINVILLSVEDDPEVVLRPRYEAQGADCKRVFLQDQTFHLHEDNLIKLEKEVALRNAGLIVIDPIIAYFPKGDTNKSKDVRDFINGLHKISKEYRIPVIAIRHWNKNTGARAAQKGIGSVDFRNASRSVLQVIKTEEKVYLALEKSNYAARAKTLTFSILDNQLQWGEECDLTSDEILKLANQEVDADKSSIEEAKEFLIEELRNGPVKSKDILKAADSDGIGRTTLKSAKKALGIKSTKIYDSWNMSLPSNWEEVEEVGVSVCKKERLLASLIPQTINDQNKINSELVFQEVTI